MYKIYINETPLILTNTEGVLPEWQSDEKTLVAKYLGKVKFLHNYIDTLEKTHKYHRVVLYSDDLKLLWSDYKNLYKRIKAAGGVVHNAQNDILLIYRRGSWDLPKGKIDKGETPEAAAIREVQEETGLVEVYLGKHLINTYHTYIINEKRILKKTYWYSMSTIETTLTPQYSEDIEKAVWVKLAEFLANSPTIYGSIFEVLQVAGN